jgi:hypothetical protein
VRFAAYLDRLEARTGALRLLPGSHRQPLRGAAKAFDRQVSRQRDDEIVAVVERLPAYVCDSEPGDVIAFDLRLYHASVHGRDRRLWTVTYYRDPEDPEEAAAAAAALADDVAADYGSWDEYDPGRYPFYDPDWIAATERTWRAPAMPAE